VSDTQPSPRTLAQLFYRPISFALLAPYIVFYRITTWDDASTRQWASLAVVTILVSCLFMTISMWIEILTGNRFDSNRLVYVIVILAAAITATYQVLVRHKTALEFEKNFNALTRQDRVIIRVMGLAAAAVIGFVYFQTVPVFQRTFYIVPTR